MFDFESVEGRGFTNDLFEQDAERRNILLSIPECKYNLPACLCRFGLEHVVKGPAGSGHTQIIVKHEKWICDRIDDRLREMLGLTRAIGQF